MLAEAHADLAVEHADRRGHRTHVAHRALGFEPDFDTLRGGEPVRDQRGLQRDDRLCPAHFVGDDDGHGMAPTCATQRAAVSTASSGPPTTKPAASASPAPVVSTASAGTASKSSPFTEIPRLPRLRTIERASN